MAAKAAPDSILAYHTALELHGVAYSSFSELTYLTTHKNKAFKFQDQWFQPTTQPNVLKKNNLTRLSTQTMNRQGIEMRVTNPARTYVDSLNRIELCGGWEEICRALANMVTLDINEVIEYCLILKNARLAAKVGYFLEQRQGAFKVDESDLAPLLAIKPKTPQYTIRRKTDKVTLIKKWNIFLPTSVINQSWEEPNAGF